MPVVMSPKNDIGPSAQIDGARPVDNKRPVSLERQIVTVWDPNGVEQKVMRQNANDLVRHAGWSRKRPITVVAAEAETVSEKSAIKAEVDKTELDTAMDALNVLRADAEALGIKVDSRWGKRRLVEEIAAAQAQAQHDDEKSDDDGDEPKEEDE